MHSIKSFPIILLFISILTLSACVNAQDAIGPVSVKVETKAKCTVALTKGWNFIAPCSKPGNSSIKVMLSEIDGLYRYVLRWDKNFKKFEVYSPKAASNPFTSLSDDYSYFVYLDASSATLNLYGSLYNDREIAISLGWNSLAYPYEFPVIFANEIINSFGDFKYIMEWDKNEQKFKIYTKNMAEKQFDRIIAGEGLFLYGQSKYMLNYNRQLYESYSIKP